MYLRVFCLPTIVIFVKNNQFIIVRNICFYFWFILTYFFRIVTKYSVNYSETKLTIEYILYRIKEVDNVCEAYNQRERVFHMIKHKKIIVSALLSLTVLAGSFAAAFAVPAFQPKAKYLSVADIRGRRS